MKVLDWPRQSPLKLENPSMWIIKTILQKIASYYCQGWYNQFLILLFHTGPAMFGYLLHFVFTQAIFV